MLFRLLLIIGSVFLLGCKNIQTKTLLIEAQEKFEQGELEAAITVYDKILASDNNVIEAHIAKGDALLKMNKSHLAKKSYLQAMKIDSLNAWAHVRISNIYREELNFQLALEHINKSLKLLPNSETILNSKGQILQFLNKHKQAIEVYSDILQINSNSLPALTGITSSYLSEEDFQKSEKFALKAMSLYPDDCTANRNIAHLNYKKNNKKSTCKYAFQATELCNDIQSLSLLNKLKEYCSTKL